jgi:hypothetical protein
MNIQPVAHILLVCFGVFIAIIGTLGMLGFGPGESIIVLCVLALIDDGLRRVYTSKRKNTR